MTNPCFDYLDRCVVFNQERYSPVPEAVHPTLRNAEPFQQWVKLPTQHVVVAERLPVLGVEHQPISPSAEILSQHGNQRGLNVYRPRRVACFGRLSLSFPHSASNVNYIPGEVDVLYLKCV